jgi:ATP phosphoribosyltransferase regulatory subunit
MDLREIARLAQNALPGRAILAPCLATDVELTARVSALREQGEIVVELLPGESTSEGHLCDRQLVKLDGQWIIQTI